MSDKPSIPLDRWVRSAQQGTVMASRPDPLPAHVGLWLDRCPVQAVEPTTRESETKGKEERLDLYNSAALALTVNGANTASKAAAFWTERYPRWEKRMGPTDVDGPYKTSVKLEATSRILLHPASGATVTEGALLLHHTWGVPYLPGSALKGLCRAYAKSLNVTLEPPVPTPLEKNEGEAPWIKVLFGDGGSKTPSDDDAAGMIIFHDALWIPPNPEEMGAKDSFSPLVRDIVNPHHTQYYTGDKHSAPPADTDEPMPTQFLTIAPKTRFLVVLEAVDASSELEQWVHFVKNHVLIPAVQEIGIGAKISAGYGRLDEVRAAKTMAQQKHGGGATAWTEDPIDKDTGLVYWDAGPGKLDAPLSSKHAMLLGDAARSIVAKFTDEQQTRARKKGIKALVKFRKKGNGFEIVDVIPD